MSWKQTVTLGELTTTRTVYTPWLGSAMGILREAGLGWATTGLLVRDVDVDFDKGMTRLSMAALGQKPGESVFDVTITLVRQDDPVEFEIEPEGEV